MKNTVALLALLSALIGCSSPNELPVPNDMRGADSTARLFTKALLAGDVGTCLAMSNDKLSQDPNATRYIAGVSNSFLGHGIDKIEIVEAAYVSLDIFGKSSQAGAAGFHRLAYQYWIAGKYLLLIFNIEERAGKYQVSDINISQHDRPVQELTKFSLSENTIAKLIILIMMIVVPSFMIYSLVRLWKLDVKLGKKLLWSFLILFLCAPSITLVTTSVSSELRFGVVLTFLGITWSRTALYQPWILTASMPVGAIWFWAKREKWTRVHDQRSDEPINFVSLHEAKLLEEARRKAEEREVASAFGDTGEESAGNVANHGIENRD